ncbi:hypothetical protein [Bradyrhizobium nanningense]|uniref:hypothetical protein n=1 Tax=Bradyrhizobium nanningense TaxID=1325118 RepID=UPI00100870BA|nr:hypothetical protein [Bradyrhizobium nanningense]
MAEKMHIDSSVSRAVPRDTERFKLLFTNGRPHIPGGKLAPVSTQPTRVLISERITALRCEEK